MLLYHFVCLNASLSDQIDFVILKPTVIPTNVMHIKTVLRAEPNSFMTVYVYGSKSSEKQ